jgi:integral membrane sensor domain MASE1
VADQTERSLQDTRMVWPALAQRLGGEHVVLIIFVVCYLPLVWLGYLFKTDALQLTVIWPSAGLMMAVLYLAPLRRWPALIALQPACEYTMRSTITVQRATRCSGSCGG